MIKAKLSTEYGPGDRKVAQVLYLKTVLDISQRLRSESFLERVFSKKVGGSRLSEYMPFLQRYWLPADNYTISKLKAIGITGEEFAMTSDRIAIQLCAALCGLDSNEFMTDVRPSAAQASLLARYLLLQKRGWATVQDLIVADIRAALDLGASKRATDLLMVLRTFLLEHPEFAIVSSGTSSPSSVARPMPRQRRPASILTAHGEEPCGSAERRRGDLRCE
jgi:hypothetical protein